MARPKVHPANRLRAHEACLACRTSKRRCGGTFPCHNCIRKGQANSCVPCRRTDPTSASQRSPSAPVQNSHGVANPLSQPETTIPSHHQVASSIPTSRCQPDVSYHTPAEQGSLSPEAPHKTHPRMLRNLQGERVYVGRAASLSFLQLLRDTVTQHIGPSQFSHNVKSEDMLETEPPHDIPSDFEEQLDFEQRQAFIRAYHIATSGFLEIRSNSETTQTLDEPTPLRNSHGQDRMASIDIVIAIGAQSSKSDPTTVRAEQFFFARGQRRAFARMLENPSLELVRLFLLMSFYMLGACRRNAAFMYLGVAARAAVALGLHHVDSSGSVTPNEQHQRARVWMSLCTLDLLVSSILGRPPATATRRSETGVNVARMAQQNSQEEERLVASYHMSLILDETIGRLYGGKAASAEVAESLLEKLNRWRDSLPRALLTSPATEHECLAAQNHIIGSLHIACSYHFAVIVVTRPFLISALGVNLAQLHQNFTGSTVDEVLQDDSAHSKLAVACIDSALYMLQTCLEIHRSGLLLGNMCILKAFVFAAALVVGFSLFARKEVDSALEEAFNGALEILHMFSQQSAQAAHYYEIITFLGNAISEQRQRLMQQERQNKSRYVSKLFSLNGQRPSPETRGSSATPVEASDTPFMSSSQVLFQPWIDNENSASLMSPLEISGVSLGWEGMELPLWDSFPFTDEPLQLPDRIGSSTPI